MQSNTNSFVKRALFTVAGTAIMLHSAILLSGCDGGSSGGPDGGGTIQGTVDSYSGGGAFYMPEPKGTIMQQWARSALEFVVPSARAAAAGVTVSVQGTDISGTTSDDGFFILSGVPPGAQTLEFSFNGSTATYAVIVPENGVIIMEGVDVNNGNVDVSNIQVIEDDDSNDDNSNDNGDDNSNDNGDDNSNDNGDDNSNDNADDNSNDNGDDNSNDN